MTHEEIDGSGRFAVSDEIAHNEIQSRLWAERLIWADINQDKQR